MSLLRNKISPEILIRIENLSAQSESLLNDPRITTKLNSQNEAKLSELSQKCTYPKAKKFIIDHLVEKYPDMPTIAELIHFELTTDKLDPQKIFVNLQKLKNDQAKIDELKEIYLAEVNQFGDEKMHTLLETDYPDFSYIK